MNICAISRAIHDLIYSDYSQSFCSRAWQHRSQRGWGLFVRAMNRLFGENHCQESFHRYHN